MIYVGDALKNLKRIPDARVDAIVTDPPYGLSEDKRGRRIVSGKWVSKGGFMGAAWDAIVPPVEVWAELRRVAKPGANLLSFGGTRTFHRLACNIEDAGWTLHDTIMWVYGTGYPKNGRSLKPAWEPIIVARNGGGRNLNADDCRVPVVDPEDFERNQSGTRGSFMTRPRANTHFSLGGGRSTAAQGRHPANLVHDASPEVLELFPKKAGAQSPVTNRRAAKHKSTFQAFRGQVETGNSFHGDSGSAARFFYAARASKADRGPGNTHPTVKPQSLMQWLVRLSSNPKDIVLDPFCGSGSTGVACKALGRHFVGIERDPAFASIAQSRMGWNQ